MTLVEDGKARSSRFAAIALGLAAAALACALIGWFRGISLFGFESPYWDLGLLPALATLAIAALSLKDTTGRRKRFLLGFLTCGVVAVIAYVASCSRPARWSLVSVLQPFQTGYMLAPRMGTSWKRLTPWGVFVDTLILILIPLLPALIVGLAVSVRLTLRRLMIVVAIVAILLSGEVSAQRRARYQDFMAHRHRDQIVGSLLGRQGADGTLHFEAQPVDRQGKPVSARQQRLDQWHEDMAQRYWHTSFYPWNAPVRETPPPQ